MLRLPDGLDAEAFLSGYWQKAPLAMPCATTRDLPALDADEVAWLATLDDVESRLIFTEREAAGERYRLQSGPFDDATLSRLPDRDWTLLVHDVEKHLPEMRRWFDEIPFIPDWRIDDLMVSVAAPGGSVGPHRDNYDVFLCQASGSRRWRVAASAEADPAAQALSLVKPFDAEMDFAAANGDVLYLPPGHAHWGVAQDLCITFSIGMRAPAKSELLAQLGATAGDDASEANATGSERFYTDPDLHADEALPGQISGRSIIRARDLFDAGALFAERDLQLTLGVVATSLKEWLIPEIPDGDQNRKALASIADGQSRALHGMSRIAWVDAGDRILLFLNGQSRECPSCMRSGIVQVAGQRCIDQAFFGREGDAGETEALLSWLVSRGALDLSDEND